MIQPDQYIRSLLRRAPGETVTARGWVKTRRDSKNVHFIQLNDGSSPVDLQVVLDAGVAPAEVVAAITTGACIEVEGELVASPGKGQAVELKARAVLVRGAANPEAYPLQKKKHTLETLREIGHLRPRSNTFGAVFRVRNALAFAIHKFFQERGFVYVHAPVISSSDAEGAGQMFQVTTLEAAKGADAGQDFFGRRTYLTVSGQLEAEILALAFANVYTFGPTFRAENSNTPRHLAEFYMIEPEMAFCDLKDDADLAEAFLKYQVEQVMAASMPDLQFLAKWYEPELIKTLEGLLSSTFERITYTEAVGRLQKSGRNFEFPTALGRGFAKRARAVFDGGAFPQAGDRDRLPEGDQSVLHALQRRWEDGGGHGRAGAAHRGDHRREPARGAIRRAAGADSRESRDERRSVLVVPGPAPLRRGGARRLRHGFRAHDDVPDGDEEYPGRDPVPANAGER